MRKRRAAVESKTAGMKLNKTAVAAVVMVIFAGIPFAFGKYFELNTPGAYDSGAYVYSAKHVLDGATLGVDERPSARLGTLFMNILGVRLFGFNDVGPKIIQGLLQAAGLIVLFIALKHVYGVFASMISVIVASIYLSAPVIAKFGNVKEQFMVAFLLIGVAFFVLYLVTQRWWWAFLTGVFIAWGPLFKETGISAVIAVGLFIVLQPILRHSNWKQTGRDVLFVFAGAIVSLAPIYIWMISGNINLPLPYESYFRFLFSSLELNGPVLAFCKPCAGILAAGGYTDSSRSAFDFAKQAPIVFRYYAILILPITLAVVSILFKGIQFYSQLKKKSKDVSLADRLVLLFIVWWLLDMVFIWISPRSYEQYYLPMVASASVLGVYGVSLFARRFRQASNKGPWIALGATCCFIMIVMSWDIFAGIETSPHSGVKYQNRQGEFERRRGYVQKFSEVRNLKKGQIVWPWLKVGRYIQSHSDQHDTIYVWGWVPGIYVQAQRLSTAPKAFEGNMHVLSPRQLSNRINEILRSFDKQMPKYLVDTQKNHFPWNRPPLQLWPKTPKGFIPNNPAVIQQYETLYYNMLEEKIDKDEAERFKAMKPFRDFVMTHYEIVRINFGNHILFRLKDSP